MDLPTGSTIDRIALVLIVLAVAGVMTFAAGEASANHVSCGDTITQDTTLDGDLDCGEVSGAGEAALAIGADGVRLNLNGHMVSATCTGECDGTAAIADSAGYDGVRITERKDRGQQSRRGLALIDAEASVLKGLRFTTDGWNLRAGVVLSGSDQNRLVRITSSHLSPGILLMDSDANEISDGTISVFGTGNFYGIRVADGSDRNRIVEMSAFAENSGVRIEDSVGNRVARSRLAGDVGFVASHADRNRIVKNLVGGFASDAAMMVIGDANRLRENEAAGIIIWGDRNRIVGNELPFPLPVGIGAAPIEVAIGDANRLRENTITRSEGIKVAAATTDTIVYGNLVTSAYDDGIDVNAPGTLIADNTATDNGDLGIEAVRGVIDGGGNRASGNGNPLQCRNVVCR